MDIRKSERGKIIKTCLLTKRNFSISVDKIATICPLLGVSEHCERRNSNCKTTYGHNKRNCLQDQTKFRWCRLWQIAWHWRHNGRDSVSNHQSHDCLLNRLFRRRSKKRSKLRVTGLFAGNSPGTGEFPAQMASGIFHLMTSSCVLIVNTASDECTYLFVDQPSKGRSQMHHECLGKHHVKLDSRRHKHHHSTHRAAEYPHILGWSVFLHTQWHDNLQQ